jgi:hypothetical protein
MSIALIRDMTENLPPLLREQVLGYAESVRIAAPVIAKDQGIELTQAFEDHITFLAGVKKLFSIVSSSYWSLDNSATLLARSDTFAITIAGRSFSRGSELHQQLHALIMDLEDALKESNVLSLVQLNFREIAEAVAHEIG